MAFTNDDIQELRDLIIEVLGDESDPIEDATQIAEFAEGDVVPVVRTNAGVSSYGKAPVELFGGGGGGGSVIIVNDLTTGGTTKALSAEMGKRLNQMIEAISGGASVKLSVSPSVIFKNTATSVTISSTFSGGTPTSISIKDGDTEIATTASTTQNVTASADKTYNVTAAFNGMTFNDSATLYARYPIYYGFGASAAAVGVAANKYTATTTAAHTYSGTASANGQYFFILVPSDISGLTQFSMGGAPFVMDEETTTAISGVTYKVYKSGNSYNSGTALTVEAK